MAKPCGVRLSGEARKQVMGTGKLVGGRGALPDRGEAGCSGNQGRARDLPQPLSFVLSLLPGDSQIPALWPVSALSMDFQGNLAGGGKGQSQVGGHLIGDGILLLTTETLNQRSGTALYAGGCLQAKSFPGGKSSGFKLIAPES